MIQIYLDDADFRRRWSSLLGRIERPRDALADIGEALVASTKQRFVDGRAPDGTSWEELSDTTLAIREALGIPGTRPLIGETKRLSREIHYRIAGETLEVGSPMEYAATQQFGALARSFTGGKTPWGDIPERPFLGLSDDDERTIFDILGEHLTP